MLSRRTAALAAVTLAGASACAQQAIYSNASVSPGVPALGGALSTSNGTPAPAGGFWSETPASGAAESNALAGLACHTDSAGGIRLADGFTVPEGQAWNLEQVWLYVYQPDLAGVGSPVAGGTLRVWRGNPSQGGQVVWGDTLTNRVTAVAATDTYRVFTTAVGPALSDADMSRRVFRVVMNAAVTLTPGQYWIDWQLTPVTPGGWLFAVPATVPGARTQAGWDAQKFMDGAWSPALDPGKPATAPDVALDVAFILAGSAGTACDTIDFNGDTILPDITDIEDFILVFGGGLCSTGTCGDIDFNNDGLFPDTQDIASLLSVFSGGACL